MWVDERIVVKKSRYMRDDATIRKRVVWTRRAAMKAIWDTRCRILKERGEDIFHLFEMTDCIEVSIRGDLETLPDPKIKKRLKAKGLL